MKKEIPLSKNNFFSSSNLMGLIHFAIFLLLITYGHAQTPSYFNNNTTTGGNSFPLNSTSSNKVQWLYGPGAFNTAGSTGTPADTGVITKVYFRIAGTASSTATYTDFTISLGQNVGTITAWPSSTYTTGLTQCFYQSSYTTTGAVTNSWYEVKLQKPFFYDPAKSLVFEMKVSGGTGNIVTSNSGGQRIFGGYSATTGTAGAGLVDFGFDIRYTPVDLAVTSIVSPVNVCGGTAEPLIVQINNLGTTNIDSGKAIPITVVLSGLTSGTTVKYFNRTLPVGGIDTIHITTLNTSLYKGTVNIKSWTKYAPDTVFSNDTILTSIYFLGNAIPISGTHSVGPSGKFSSIKSALDSINLNGIKGHVILELASNYSSASETFPLIIPSFIKNNFCGAANINGQLTIRPASGGSNILISGTATALFMLDNSYKFTIDGRPGGTGTAREIHLRNTSTSGTVFTLQNDAVKNTIRNCNIRASNTSSTSGAIFIGGSTRVVGNDSNTIINNNITKVKGNTLATGISVTGTSLIVQNDNNNIIDNEIHSWTTFGINVTATAGNGPNWTIIGNSFYDSAASTSTAMTSINFIPGTTSNSVGNIISGNYIGGSAANAGSTPWINSASTTFRGIVITANAGTPTLVQNNIIQNISLTSTSGTLPFTAINPSGGSVIIGGASGKGNIIGHTSTAGSIKATSNNVIIGINASTANDIVISHNLVANISQTNTGTTAAVRGIINTSGTMVSVNNNIVKSLTTNSGNAGTTTSASVIGIMLQSTGNNQLITDNTVGGSVSEGLSNTNTTLLARVIGIANTGGITTIKGNKINGLSSTTPTTSSTTAAAIIGLYFAGTAGSLIDNNDIRNISNTAAAVTQIEGIYIGSGANTVSNNTVSSITSASTNTGTTTAAAVIGIIFNSAIQATIKNNTVENISATAIASSEIIGILVGSSLSYVQNNSIRNISTNSSSVSTTLASIIGIAITASTITPNKNITGNRIYNLNNNHATVASMVLGIYSANTTIFGNNSSISNNLIHSFKLATSGIGVMMGILNISGNVTFQNNMIRLGIDSLGNTITGNYNIKGIVQNSASSCNYYNNSIYLAGTSAGTTNTACIDFTATITTTETVNLKNNIFYNNISNSSTGRNACIRITSSNGRIFSNHNLLYAPNTKGTLGIISTTAYDALKGTGSWNLITLMDGQSSTGNPNYITPNGTHKTVDLHLGTTNPAEGAGDPLLTFVLDDFDGQTRSSFTPNDIGADAGNFTSSADIVAPSIIFTPLSNTSSTADRAITVNIIDQRGLPKTTANAPRIYFKKGAGIYYSNAGSLSSGTMQNGTWNFTIGQAVMGGVTSADIISYYIVAQDSAGNMVSNAMHAIGTNVNTITTAPALPNTYTVFSPLSTTINVGSGQTYTSLTESSTAGLFNAINNAGLQGNTVVNITSDLTETGAIALNQWIETGGSNYTLTIRPSAAARRTVSGSASPSNGLIRLNGADRVTITGIPSGGSTSDTFLMIRSTSTSVSALTLMTDASNNTIENCNIESASTGTNGVVFISPTGLLTGNDNNTIRRCHIRAVSASGLVMGLYAAGQLPTSILPIALNDNITISDCHFYNFSTYGVYVNTGNGDNWNILNNHFYWKNPTPTATSPIVVFFTPGLSSNNNTISGNYIGGSAPSAGGSAWVNSGENSYYGVYVNAGTTTGTSIQNNTIKNIELSDMVYNFFLGIYIAGGVADVGGTSGNIIGDPATANSIRSYGDDGLIGIYTTSAHKLTVSNNSISNITSYGTLTLPYVNGIYIGSGTAELNIKNNTIKNLTTSCENTGSSSLASVLGIGVAASGNVQNIWNNTIQNLKNTNDYSEHCVVGLCTVSGLNSIKGNVISELYSSSISAFSNSEQSALIGMLVQNTLAGSEVSDNKISNLTYDNISPYSTQTIGLFVNSVSAIKITNNTVSSINSVSNSPNSGVDASIIGISYSGGGTLMDISQNTIHSLTNTNPKESAYVVGLYFSGSTVISPSKVSRNFIHSLRSKTSAYSGIYGIYNAGGYATFENNMLRLGIDSSGTAFSDPHEIHGIYQAFANTTCIYYHNSIYMGGSPSSGSSMTSAFTISSAYSTTSTRAIIKNNIFFNAVNNTGSAAGKNYAIKLGSFNLINSNNNIFYTTGSGGTLVGTSLNYTSLKGASGWQAASGIDLNSGSANPNFVNATGTASSVDLHLSNSNPAEGIGDMDVTTTLDFDGNARSGTSPVDVGAHSGNFTLSSDIIAPGINFIQLTNTGVLTGVRTLANVRITDNIGIPMTGGNIPRIYFSKNGTTWYSSAASSLTGTAKSSVALFEINYSALGGVSVGDSVLYYVIAQDNAGNMMSNGLYAEATDVNTVTTHPNLPLKYKLLQTIAAGSKLKVGTGSTFPTITGSGGLFEYLNTVALGGNIKAVITSNTIEPGTFALNQLGDNGSGSYTLTICPDSLTTAERLISGIVNNGMIRLDGADRVKFTGISDFNGTSTNKKIRFRNSSLTGQVFLFVNEATDNRLHNLNIESSNTSTTTGVINFSTSNKSMGNSRDTISSCMIGDDKTGILPLSGVPAYMIYSIGDAFKENTANVIMNNEIFNFGTYGVLLTQPGNGNNWKVINNSFYRSLFFPAFALQYAINFNVGVFSSGHTISNNYIGGQSALAGGGYWENSASVQLVGIRSNVGIDNPTEISGNIVQNLKMTNIATGAQFIGLFHTDGNANINNNLIGHPTNINSIIVSGAITTGQMAIQCQANGVNNIVNNKIQGINCVTQGVASPFFGINSITGNTTIANNIVGSATVANSIQYAGTSALTGIQSQVAAAVYPTVLISGNTVANLSASGTETAISLRGIYLTGTAQPTVTNNTVFNLSTNSTNSTIIPPTAVNGIVMVGSSLGGTISNNTVYGIKALNSGNFITSSTGIGLNVANSLIISNNRIYDIINLSTSANLSPAPTASGINLSTIQDAAYLYNNQISLGTGQSNGNMFIGIWQSVSGSFTINTHFNSVYIGGTASSGNGSSFGFLRGNNFITSSYSSVVNAKNNILMNERSGGAGKHYAIGNQNIISTFQNGWLNNASNYNFISNTTGNPIGLWNISDYNFNDWKSNSNSDLNSIYMPTGNSSGQINPANLFQNAAVGNLSLIKTNAEALNVVGKAIPIAGITSDYDNLTRNSSTPTIGSSEAYLNDVGVSTITSINNTCGKPVTTITVTLKNYGLQSQSNIPVKLVGTGAGSFNFTETVSGPIASNATVSYTFTGTFNSVLGGIYNFKSYTNISNDGVKTNDSASSVMSFYPLPKPSFSYTDTCFGNPTKFTSSSTVTVGSITNNSWKFGDGGVATGNTVNHTYATGGTSYNVKIISTSSNGCIDSSSKSIFILSNLAGGVIATNQTICYNTTPSLISNSTASSGSKAPYTYQWQSSTDNVTFSNISAANGLDYQPGGLTVTTYYRRAVTTTSGCGPVYSNTIKITVNSILTSGIIGSPQTICYNGTGSSIGFTTNPSGAFGTYTYQWQSSPDSSTWSNITGQTANTFTPTNVTNVTYYRNLVFSGSCPSAGTNGVKIKLYSPITGGAITAGQTICAGTTPAAFTQTTAPSGGPGTYTFQWESSTDSINWNTISGANSSGYSSGALSTLTYFRRLAGSTGCPSGVSNALKVRTNFKPNVVFTASNHCFNDPMPLSNSSNISSGTLTYLWKFGDGGTSTSSVPNKTYVSSGTYNVTLVATSNLGCKDSSTKSVIVATTPLPSYTFALKCQGDSVIFTDNTVYACGAGSGLTFRWEFGDGTNSNVQHARHHYNSAGTYNVKFKISLPGGFRDSIIKTVVFNIRSTPGFTATNDCFPAATSFTNSSTGYTSLAWSFGDGTTSTTTSSTFTKTYTVAGTYNAKLVSTSSFGCKDSVSKTISLFSKPKATFSASNNCVGLTTAFNNSSSGAASYSWNFGDGRTSGSVNPSNTYASAGTYTIKLKVTSTNGCVDSTSSTITIYPNPVPDFTTANVCNGFVSSFTNTSTGASSYAWNFGNGNTSTATNPTYTYPTPGNYTVTLTATTSNGCSQSTNKSYTVNSAPTAAFSGSNVCLGNSITFSNSSTGATGSNWNFGDATTSTASSPTKTYSASGNFNVKLVVSNSFGCKDSITKSVTIFTKPGPAFTANNECFGKFINFANNSSAIASCVWLFGDGKSSAALSPIYYYAAAGNYTVKLIVTSPNGCRDSLSKTVTVYQKPTVSFTASPDPICRGGIMNFTNTTTNGSTYKWTFGNGNTSTATSPTNIYNTHGNYNVMLESTSSNGCTESLTKTVTVWPRPVASFKVNDGCATDNLAFATNSVGAVGHEWTFGDATTSTSANPSKGYTNPGTYNVKLIVTSINGCKDTTNSNVTVHPRASVSFTNSSNFCVGLSTTFTNTSTLSTGTMTHQWSFGDGNTSSNTNPTNMYTAGGNYTVKLTTTTDKGCININTSSVLVYPKPAANFNAASVCAGGTVTFNNTTVGGTTYLWDFGDAGSSTLTSPTHTYTNAGNYTVKLTANNATSCTDVFTQQIVIFANPTANFTVTDKCIGQTLAFANSSTGANDVQWQFGDGNSSNSFNPNYTYKAPGTFNVTLNIKSINGCLGAVSKSVTVFAAPKAAFSTNDNEQCINGNIFSFTNNSTGGASQSWTFGDGNTSTAMSPTKSYAAAGNYNVKLTVTSSNGCTDETSGSVMVNPKPTANFNINNPAQCVNGNFFSFSDASTISQGSINRMWDLGDGSIAGGSNAVKNYSIAGTYTVTLNVQSDFGCSDNISKTVTVNASPTASFTFNDDIQCLNGNSFNFSNTTSGAATFNSTWKLGDGFTIATTNASRTYAAAGNYKVTLNVNTPFGCKDSAYYTMKVLANPGAVSISGPNTAPNGSVQAYSVPATSGSTYNWVATNGVVLSNGSNLIQVKWNTTGTTGNIAVTETGENTCMGIPANQNVSLTPLGISQVVRNAFAAKLYPNPGKDNFTVEVATGDMVTMSIYDELGREVMRGQRFSSSIIITDHNLAAGIYAAKLTTDKGKTTILRFEVIN